MHRKQIKEMLTAYKRFWIDTPRIEGSCEEEVWQNFAKFVETQPKCFERELSIGHVTGSAVVLDEAHEHILLLHHKKLGKWLQLGGHSDSDPDPFRVALKEAYEESSLTSLESIDNWMPTSSVKIPLDLDIHLIPARKQEAEHYHYDVRFVFQVADGNHEFKINHEANELRWVKLEELQELSQEESMLRQVDKILALKNTFNLTKA